MPKLIEPQWSVPKHIVAYTTTRSGGFSTGKYASLNVGHHVGDDADAVAKNRSQLPFAERLCWLEQVHSDTCINLSSRDDVPVGDAAVSSKPDFFCAVMTADCVPILLTTRSGSLVAAIHAGWQGLLTGIIANTVAKMQCPGQDILAWIGPAISQKCYEVDSTLASRFKNWPAALRMNGSAGKAYLNLPLVAQLQLNDQGISRVVNADLCTYTRDDLFFSHRRAQHQNLGATGRMVTVIGIHSGCATD